MVAKSFDESVNDVAPVPLDLGAFLIAYGWQRCRAEGHLVFASRLLDEECALS